MEIVKKKSIILVGNGPSILDYKKGKEIDNFDMVIRFNNFEIDEFSESTGTKTTIWARNNSNGVFKRDVSSFKEIWIVSPEWNFGNTKKIASEFKKSFVIPQKTAKEIQQTIDLKGIRARDKRDIGWPSSGIITLYHVLKTQKDSDIYIHGFDHFKGENHYFGEEKKFCFIENIRKKEEEWVENLIQEGKIRRLCS